MSVEMHKCYSLWLKKKKKNYLQVITIYSSAQVVELWPLNIRSCPYQQMMRSCAAVRRWIAKFPYISCREKTTVPAQTYEAHRARQPWAAVPNMLCFRGAHDDLWSFKTLVCFDSQCCSDETRLLLLSIRRNGCLTAARWLFKCPHV